MYVNTEKVKRSVFGNGYENRYRISVFRNIKYRAICMEWRIYSGFKEKTGKRYEGYYAG